MSGPFRRGHRELRCSACGELAAIWRTCSSPSRESAATSGRRRLVREAREFKGHPDGGRPHTPPESRGGGAGTGDGTSGGRQNAGVWQGRPMSRRGPPRPTAGTLVTRVDRPLDLGIAGGPGVQAPLPHVAGQVMHSERAHPAGRVTDNGGASRIARQAASFTSSGGSKSGIPCPRLIAPCFWAIRVISRITDSVKNRTRSASTGGVELP